MDGKVMDFKGETVNFTGENKDFAEEIISYGLEHGFQCETIKNAKDVSVVMKKYEDLLIEGRKKDFTPLIIVPDGNLSEAMEYFYSEGNANIEDVIKEGSKEINAENFLNNRIKEAMPVEEEDDYDIMGEFVPPENVNSFISLIDYSTGAPYKTIIVAKIPTDKPWELAAWIPMGGWNECPSPEEQVAVFKYWYEKYGAIPAVVHSDIWELYIEEPPKTKDAASSLALEQFGFCSDIVYQGVGTINALASNLLNSKYWYFWWD